MKIKVSILLFILSAFEISASTPSFKLNVWAISGTVTDATTNEPLPGAIISIPELQRVAHTDQNGNFSFTKIASKGRFLVEVRYIGYKTMAQIINLSSTESLNFALEPSVIEVHEIVITGTTSGADNRNNSTSVTSLNKEELMRHSPNNIVEAISRVPGVSQITTGPGISKPVIRGLSANRILTLADGVKQEGQQWGDEHGLEIDQYSAERVEILRGAASLLYGSDALGGVINIIDPLPASIGQIKAEILSNYSSNNGLSATSAMLEGNTNGFVWQGRGTYKNAFSYNTGDGRIPNTGFKENNFSGVLGLNKVWGFAHLNISSFNQKLGLPDFEKNSDGEFENGNGIPFTETQLKSRKLLLPFQDVRHHKIALNSQLLFNKGRLRSVLAYQNNQRREMEESTTEPSLFFDLQTYSYDFKYYLEENNGWEPVFGVSGAFQNSKNKAEELLIPDYDNTDVGAFAYLKKSWLKTTVNAGLRFDFREISGIEMVEDGNAKFSNFKNTFTNLSGAVGLTHELNEYWNIKANLGSAFRAPNIAELSSDGVHEGTFRYEIGKTDLDPERSVYADAALEFHNHKVDFHFNIYNNYISDYIFARRSGNETVSVDGQNMAVYRYGQDNANLYGLEAGLTLHPTSYLHFENTYSITRGTIKENNNNLPFIPATTLSNEIRFEPSFKLAGLNNTYVSIGLDNVFKQNRIDKEFETATAGYTLLNATAGTTLKLNNQQLRVYFSGNNLLNKSYVNHLNRLKYAGMLNQSRNISFGFQLPLNF